MKEKWKNIKGFEFYQISDHGNVRNSRTGKILKPSANHENYLVVQLCSAGQKKNKKIHRLVAEAFVPNPDNLPQVDHIKGDRHDNRASKLRWVSCSSNTRNTITCKQSTSKYNGVHLHQPSGKYRVSVWFEGKNKHLGTFTEERKAASVFNDFCIQNKLNREINIITEG